VRAYKCLSVYLDVCVCVCVLMCDDEYDTCVHIHSVAEDQLSQVLI
jgi:hypothetical protein